MELSGYLCLSKDCYLLGANASTKPDIHLKKSLQYGTACACE